MCVRARGRSELCTCCFYLYRTLTFFVDAKFVYTVLLQDVAFFCCFLSTITFRVILKFHFEARKEKKKNDSHTHSRRFWPIAGFIHNLKPYPINQNAVRFQSPYIFSKESGEVTKMAKAKRRKMPKRENDFHLCFCCLFLCSFQKKFTKKRVLGLHVNRGTRFDCTVHRLRKAEESSRNAQLTLSSMKNGKIAFCC